MTEGEFWSQLQFLTCGELARIEAARALGLWCDGFVPETYHMEDNPPRISGRAWIAAGQKGQEQWPFVLELRRRYEGRTVVPWASLLPSREESGWLEVDLEARRLQIRPPASRILLGQGLRPTGSQMKAGSEDDLDDCLRLAQESLLPVEVLGGGVPEDRFTRLLLVLARRWGDPDHPCMESWRNHLGIPGTMLAVWDFDYHAVSLTLQDGVLALRHVPSSTALAEHD